MSILNNRIPLLCLLLLHHQVEVSWAHAVQVQVPIPATGAETIAKSVEGIKKTLERVHIPHLPIPDPQINCKERCFERCSLAERYRMCFRTCNTCCQRCNCVPPGTQANTQACPCWNTEARNTCP